MYQISFCDTDDNNQSPFCFPTAIILTSFQVDIFPIRSKSVFISVSYFSTPKNGNPEEKKEVSSFK